MTTAQNQDTRLYKGAEIAIKTLEALGVDTVFAYPGGAAIEFHQALKDSPIRVILPRNEQGGAFAADGYARVTGKTGVCMATSGPGATNLLTGIADAYMDSIPMVIITGQVATSFIGKNAFQETDIIGMTRPIVKHSYLVLDENDIVSTLSVATSSLVTTLVLAVGVLCLVPLRPVLENPALAPAFNNVIPALFGALAFKYFSKSLKLAAAPLAFMCVLFVLVPSLIGSVSFLILVSGGMAIGIAYWMFRTGRLG